MIKGVNNAANFYILLIVMKGETRSCKICNRTIYGAEEKKVGICRNCKFSAAGLRCVKCGSTLFLSSEKSTRVCKRCQTHSTTCLKCGKILLGSRERQEGICGRCKSR